MAVKYVKDFEFPSDFGFSHSANTRTTAVAAEGGHVDDGTYVSQQKRAKGGSARKHKFADGGSMGAASPLATPGTQPAPSGVMPLTNPAQLQALEAASPFLASRMGALTQAAGGAPGGTPVTGHATMPGPGPYAQMLGRLASNPNATQDIRDDIAGRPTRPAITAGETPEQIQAAMQGFRGQMHDWRDDLVSDIRSNFHPQTPSLPPTGGTGTPPQPMPPVPATGGLPPGTDLPTSIGGPQGVSGLTGLARGGKFIQSAIKHPGRETRRAKAAGRSTQAQMEHDKHSPSASLRSAASLGLRMTHGDLSPRKKR